jgi:hypothetical protein
VATLYTDCMSQPTAPTPEPAILDRLTGRLFIYVAFDWGESIDLNRAARRAGGSSVVAAVGSRPRTPASITYRIPPLRFPLGPTTIHSPWPMSLPVASAAAAVFDFAAVSVTLQVPFHLTPAELLALAGRLAEGPTSAAILRAAREALTPLHEQLLPAIEKPAWNEHFWEEYFVFQLAPADPVTPELLMEGRASWMAGLLRLEDEPLSDQEVQEALRLSLRYGRRDLFVPDWGAAVLLDQTPDCDETLQAIEFANLQLLEYRHIDGRLDDILDQADHLLERLARARLSVLRGHDRALQSLGALKVEANGLFERTGNVLKLVGDQYLARVYRQLSTRFHLPAWEKSIGRKLDVLEGIYQVIADSSSAFRSEFMEVIVILLIAIEIVLALVKH